MDPRGPERSWRALSISRAPNSASDQDADGDLDCKNRDDNHSGQRRSTGMPFAARVASPPDVLTSDWKGNAMSVALADERNSAMNRGNLADLNAFVVVANRLTLRAASTQLGVTASALSHSMRQLEERLGVRLLHRTTRSVSLTDAGLRLLEQLRPAIDQISGALENLNQQRQRPFGRLRIHASPLAAPAVIAPMWGRFLSTYPEVRLELLVDMIQ